MVVHGEAAILDAPDDHQRSEKDWYETQEDNGKDS
jgi:hypothetical protein